MPQTPRQSPANSGPGRGTPRTRTTARPGDRSNRSQTEPVDPKDAAGTAADTALPPPRAARALTATWRALILIAVVGALALVVAHSLRVYFDQRNEIAALNTQIAAEKSNIDGLKDQLQRWNDPEYVRAIARERLGWVMPGEVGYRVLDADGKPLAGTSIETEEDAPSGPWWEKMWATVKIADSPPSAEDKEAQPANTPDPDRIIKASPSASPSPKG